MYLSAWLYRTDTQNSVSEFLGLFSKLFSFLGFAVWLMGITLGIWIIIVDGFVNWYYGFPLLAAYAYIFYVWRKYTMKIRINNPQIESKNNKK